MISRYKCPRFSGEKARWLEEREFLGKKLKNDPHRWPGVRERVFLSFLWYQLARYSVVAHELAYRVADCRVRRKFLDRYVFKHILHTWVLRV